MAASHLFPPRSQSALKSELELVLGQSPENYDQPQSRWTLKAIGQVVSCLHGYTMAGIWRVLRSMRIRHLRGRQYVHSPDRYYKEKLKYLLDVIRNYDPQRQEIYFMDQLTVYLHPSVGYDWAKAHKQPLARQGYRSNRTFRICGAINCFTGQIEHLIRGKISIPALVQFFHQLLDKHPGKTIFIVLDNWTVHWHPDIRAVLQEQAFPFSMNLPASWQHLQPKKKYIGQNLPVQLIYLPSYASWLNPIEKLWRWVKQEIIHNHRFTDAFDELKNRVVDWLNDPAHREHALLHYVGLENQDGIFASALLDAKTNMSKNV